MHTGGNVLCWVMTVSDLLLFITSVYSGYFCRYQVHRDKIMSAFKRVLITRDKVGFKFGEFSFTRKHVSKYNNSFF